MCVCAVSSLIQAEHCVVPSYHLPNSEWKDIIPEDSTLDGDIEELNKKIAKIKGTLSSVQKMEMQLF